ncbi:MAG: hypothetical protein V8Q81_01975 [Christensenellales bacterium]
MKRSLRGSRQQPLPDMNNLNQTAQNIDPAMLNDVQSVVDKYGGKSEQELIGELAAAKRSGIIIPMSWRRLPARSPPCSRQNRSSGWSLCLSSWASKQKSAHRPIAVSAFLCLLFEKILELLAS